jgi:hypothetical protein
MPNHAKLQKCAYVRDREAQRKSESTKTRSSGQRQNGKKINRERLETHEKGGSVARGTEGNAVVGGNGSGGENEKRSNEANLKMAKLVNWFGVIRCGERRQAGSCKYAHLFVFVMRKHAD